AGIRRIDPQVEPALLEVVVEIEVADARLDQRIGSALVDLDHAIHALQVQHDTAGVDGRRAAAGEVAPGRARIEREAPRVGGADDGLHLLDRGRRNRGGREALLGLAPEGRVRVPVQGNVLVGRENPVGADCGAELVEGGAEVGVAYTWWIGHGRIFL